MARARVASSGIPAPLLLMLSSGGLTHVAEAQRVPVQMLESGPAAGAIAAAFFGRADGDGARARLRHGRHHRQALAGRRRRAAHRLLASRPRGSSRFIEGSGLPIRISTIELIEIGAGGGSIAAIDEIGLLKVGPRSAGSHPGPAAYGLGGTEPTVTDADFLLGYLNPDYFAGGEVAVDMAAAIGALERLARRLGARVHQGRVGHPRHRQREHGGGGARAHRRARARPARLRAALHRRRGAGARLLGGAQARDRARDLPAVGRGGLRARAAGGAGAGGPRGHRRHPARSGQHRGAGGRLRAARGARRAR